MFMRPAYGIYTLYQSGWINPAYAAPGISSNKAANPNLRFGHSKNKAQKSIKERGMVIPIAVGLATISAVFRILPKTLRTRIETKLLYYPTEPIAVNDDLKANVVQFPVRSGINLYGLHFRAKTGKPTIIFSNGNAGSLSLGYEFAKSSKLLEKGYGMLVYDYPGYGRSQGKPSEIALYNSLEAASDYLIESGVPLNSQIAMGWSLGGAVTAHVASKRQFRAVILASTFTNLPDAFAAMRQKYRVPKWWFPVSRRVTQKFDTVSKVQNIKSPTLILHGADDNLCPDWHADRLFNNLGSHNKTLKQYAGIGHNNIFEAKGFQDDLVEFLRQHL